MALAQPPKQAPLSDARSGLANLQWSAWFDEVWRQIRTGTPISASLAWGSLTGTLSSQTDLQAALDAKLDATDYAAPPTFVDDEIPSGVIDGSNTVFQLAFAPSPEASLRLYKNGILMRRGGDYTLTGINLALITAPLGGSEPDVLEAFYRY